MTEFWWGAIALLALAGVFLLLPGIFLRKRRIADPGSTNRDWFMNRQAELEPGAGDTGVDDSQKDELLQDARLRLLEEADAEQGDSGNGNGGGTGVQAPVLLAILALVAVGLYWQLGGNEDVALKRQLDALTAESSEADYRRLMLKVEDRSIQRPDNLNYQAMLGRFYMNEGDYVRARAVYLSLAELAPNDAGAPALAAQAGFLAAGRQLGTEDQLLAEKALSIDPHQRTALGLLGMVAYEKQEYQAAVTYWRRLLVMEDPTSSAAEMIRGVIAQAEAAAAGVTPPPHSAVAAAEPAAAPEPAASAGAGVTVRLELAQGATPAPGDTVFVFARNPAIDTRMPVAVKRLTASQLPVTLRLDDASSMAGQKISELAAVDVVARVSPSGQPGEQHATLQASMSDLPPGSGEQVHTLVLRPVGDPVGDS